MALPVTDNFNRADGALGANWTDINSSAGVDHGIFTVIKDSQYTIVNGGNYTAWSFWNADSFPPDQYSQATVTTLGLNGTDCLPSVVVRAAVDSSQNSYYLLAGRNTFGLNQLAIELWKSAGGVLTDLKTILIGPGIIAVGDVFKLMVSGRILTVFQNGNQIFVFRDTSLAVGAAGIGVDTGGVVGTNTTLFDTWSGSGLAYAAPSDNFNRADSRLDSVGTTVTNWLTGTTSNANGFNISGNKVTGMQASTSNNVFWDALTISADQSSQATVSGTPGVQALGVTVRSSAASVKTYYVFLSGGDSKYHLFKFINNSSTELGGTGTGTVISGDVLKISAVGTTITGYVNEISTISVTDSAIASGYPGLWCFGNTGLGFLDNWSAEDLGTPVITGFTPSLGPVGTTVIISGTNLGPVTAVTFNGVSASFTADNAIQITAVVPAGAGTGPIVVTALGGTGTSASNFIITNVYSVPDCRVIPNLSRNVQGTLTYDVQTSSNLNIPPTDSRTAGAPVDSRIAPNIPENSRTPGMFGPGE